eukprot:7794944-Pyramimonas_sp.AAC.1
MVQLYYSSECQAFSHTHSSCAFGENPVLWNGLRPHDVAGLGNVPIPPPWPRLPISLFASSSPQPDSL